ncbi:Pycsar system effector family protein [Aeromicrobium ginsengisoli]|uniref:Pycsar effector protein domain-containing protein n=1 Tax=Aeromicrobium ginsengisoli TaxID=363867 RepID=A0A5M4FFN4_9ACTN|nr:Pycsar system effector family protein [Aeromicrobium ginsengisoli]KAA1397633.1 hypothetical protein ESP70_009755 [Aeromicrobium ginsengisoli]
MAETPPAEHDSSSNPAGAIEPEVPIGAEPDQAWKALSLVNDWIKHADAKVGASLAVSGVIAVMLYNLVKDQHQPGCALNLFTVLCAAAVVLAGGSAALALMPRLTIASKWEQRAVRRAAKAADVVAPEEPQEDPINLLFFSNIAKEYDGDGPSYVEVLRSLTSDPERLTRQIAHQVHANATVAHRKFTWADRAIRSLVVALALLGVVAIIVGLRA